MPLPLPDIHLQALVNTVLILLTAVSIYLHNRNIAQAINSAIDQYGAASPSTVKASPSLLPTRAVRNAGSGMAPSTFQLPAWNQLNDPLPDGTQDPFAASDCGEECVAMAVYGTTGVVLSAGDVRYLLRGASGVGLTTGGDIRTALRIHNRPSTVAFIPWSEAIAAIEKASAELRPAIVLGTWLGTGVLHWVIVTHCQDGTIHFNDPWGGVRRKLSYDQAGPLYAGTVVELLETVKYG